MILPLMIWLGCLGMVGMVGFVIVDYLRLRRRRQRDQREELALPWAEHVDGQLARQMLRQVFDSIQKHWELVLNWGLAQQWRNSPGVIVLDQALGLSLRVNCDGTERGEVQQGSWNIYLFTEKEAGGSPGHWCYRLVVPDQLGQNNTAEDLSGYPATNSNVVETLQQHHPRELVEVLDNDVIERRLLRGLGQDPRRCRLTTTSRSAANRQISLAHPPEASSTAEAVGPRLRDLDDNDSESLPVSTSA